MTPVTRQLLHVVQISFFNDPQGRSPEQLLQAWSSLVDVAEAAGRSAVRVSVVQACSYSQRLTRQGVQYYFLPFEQFSSTAGAASPLCELLRTLAPDVFHVHGLGFPRDVLALSARLPGVPIVIQDHANRAPRFWRRPLWRRALAGVAGVAFCAREQAQPFAAARVIHPDLRLFEIPESTCRFTPGGSPVESAAGELQPWGVWDASRPRHLRGDPAVLWVGHLDANKDPLTVLEGISAASRELPGLRLYCCFGGAPLLAAVQSRIAADSRLRARVHLLGRVPHGHIEQLMRAADMFVLGSHREGSGYALIEALACGLPPVVTDIPSFRTLTGGGAVGVLWPCGDPRALCEAIQSLAARVDLNTRAAVRAHFDRELSFAALGAKLAAMYEDVQIHRRGMVASTGGSTVNEAMRTP